MNRDLSTIILESCIQEAMDWKNVGKGAAIGAVAGSGVGIIKYILAKRKLKKQLGECKDSNCKERIIKQLEYLKRKGVQEGLISASSGAVIGGSISSIKHSIDEKKKANIEHNDMKNSLPNYKNDIEKGKEIIKINDISNNEYQNKLNKYIQGFKHSSHDGLNTLIDDLEKSKKMIIRKIIDKDFNEARHNGNYERDIKQAENKLEKVKKFYNDLIVKIKKYKLEDHSGEDYNTKGNSSFIKQLRPRISSKDPDFEYLKDANFEYDKVSPK